MPFQLKARYVLLTYSQCGDLDPFQVVNLLADLGAECIVGREAHADEGTHLHAFVDFGKPYRTRNERQFDVAGYHPNVLPFGRTPEKGWDYATKDGDVVGGGLERPDRGSVSKTSIDWSRIADAGCVDEFWSLVRELAPRALLTNFTSLRAYSEWHYRPERTPYESPRDITFDLEGVPEVLEWVHDNVLGSSVGVSCTLRHLATRGYPDTLRKLRGGPLPPLTLDYGAPFRNTKC